MRVGSIEIIQSCSERPWPRKLCENDCGVFVRADLEQVVMHWGAHEPWIHFYDDCSGNAHTYPPDGAFYPAKVVVEVQS